MHMYIYIHVHMYIYIYYHDYHYYCCYSSSSCSCCRFYSYIQDLIAMGKDMPRMLHSALLATRASPKSESLTVLRRININLLKIGLLYLCTITFLTRSHFTVQYNNPFVYPIFGTDLHESQIRARFRLRFRARLRVRVKVMAGKRVRVRGRVILRLKVRKRGRL